MLYKKDLYIWAVLLFFSESLSAIYLPDIIMPNVLVVPSQTLQFDKFIWIAHVNYNNDIFVRLLVLLIALFTFLAL